jgi:hypothetical protein
MSTAIVIEFGEGFQIVVFIFMPALSVTDRFNQSVSQSHVSFIHSGPFSFNCITRKQNKTRMSRIAMAKRKGSNTLCINTSEYKRKI